jgi:hypothetical protein
MADAGVDGFSAGIGARTSTLPQPSPKQQPAAAALQLRTVQAAPSNCEFPSGADTYFLVALGALNADGKRVSAFKMPADMRTRCSPAVLERSSPSSLLGGREKRRKVFGEGASRTQAESGK